MTVVIDASVLVAALVDNGREGRWAESVVAGEVVASPELVMVETTSVLRRLERTKDISSIEATTAHRNLLRLDFELL